MVGWVSEEFHKNFINAIDYKYSNLIFILIVTVKELFLSSGDRLLIVFFKLFKSSENIL